MNSLPNVIFSCFFLFCFQNFILFLFRCKSLATEWKKFMRFDNNFTNFQWYGCGLYRPIELNEYSYACIHSECMHRKLCTQIMHACKILKDRKIAQIFKKFNGPLRVHYHIWALKWVLGSIRFYFYKWVPFTSGYSHCFYIFKNKKKIRLYF